MFLNRLSIEQKELFLDLCIHASKSNNDFSAEEKETINQYCEEMHINIRYDEEHDLNEIADKLAEISSEQDLRMILLETAGLLLSDNKYDDEEKKFFDTLAEKLGLDKAQTDDVIGMLRELTDVYTRINGFVFG
jgi:tellurite resistance protein